MSFPPARPHRTPAPPGAGRMCAALVLAAATALAGCAPSGSAASGTTQVRIGYFPNLTHAPALIADHEGYLERRLGAGAARVQSFNAGPEVVQALFAGSLDIAYVGPNPTITAYARSQGQVVRVIAGSTSGGASLVVRTDIARPADLRGATLATPQLGNTQDVALRYWLTGQGLTADTEGGGDVKVVPQKNATALQAFVSGQIDGAWVPEPFATQFVRQGARRLVDERDIWPGHEFVTTNVVVRAEFLAENPQAVRGFLEAHLDALQLVEHDPERARAAVIAQIGELTGQHADPAVLAEAWEELGFTADPLPETLRASAEHASSVGLLETPPADGFARLWDLSLLDAALKARGLPPVGAP